MSVAFKPFLISEFKTGISTYLQPWARPQDAFEPLVNAYTYRGVVSKRAGMSQFGNQTADKKPIMGIMRWQNGTTGVSTLMVATTVNLYMYNPGPNTFTPITLPASFTGKINNFFNWTNWQPVGGGPSYLYLCNNNDRIIRFDGTVAIQPTLAIDSTLTPVTITTCLDVQVYKGRMLYIRPTLSTGGIQNQSIYWSAISNGDNVITDVAGSGGYLAAPTGDVIQATEFVRDTLIVFFSNSVWAFKFTGDQTQPFIWQKLDNVKTTNSPYASIDYDERATSIGNTGIFATDGVNTQRFDLPIIDFYESIISEQYYAQAFSQRYDNLNQSWTLYVSSGSENPVVGGVAPGSDSALIYNFLENSWATYTFSIPLTCLGIFYKVSGKTWAQYTQTWDTADVIWASYTNQKNSPILLAGDTTGSVWLMDDGNAVTDNGNPIVPTIKTTRWNPLMELGQKIQFGYIDIYYLIASTDPKNPIQVTLNFYTDNSDNYDQSTQRTLTLDGPKNSTFTFKRIYLNVIGEFIRMEIDPNVNSFMQFLGFIVWVRPAGRLTP